VTDLPHVGFLRGATLAGTIEQLQRRGAVPYAGGTDLLVELSERRERSAAIRLLVDIKQIPEARGIEQVNGWLRVGALSTASDLMYSDPVRRHAPALAEAAALTAAPALRRRGTLGGNLCTPHPAGDVATALLALDASVEIAGVAGSRLARVAEILGAGHGPRTDEVILAARVYEGERSAFEKFGPRLTFCRAIVAAAVCRRGQAIAVALAGVAPHPIRARHAERALMEGTPLQAALLHDCVPADDEAASSTYRLRLAVALLQRCVKRIDSKGLVHG